MVRAQKEKKNPRELAQKIVVKLKKDETLSRIVSKIEVAGSGFINLFISQEALLKNLQDVAKDKAKYGQSDYLKGKKIMVEYAHPNTHKPFHIGHLRNITTGEAITRLLEAVGVKVTRVNYQGDIGLHIAKALWGIKKLGFKDSKNVKKRMEFLGKAYVWGNKAYEEDENAKKEIAKMNVNLYNSTDTNLVDIYNSTRKWSLDYFEQIYKRVGTKFDRLYFESEVAESGKGIAKKALKKGILKRSKGAIIYPGEDKGLHTRVFITSEDLATYEAKDLGLAELQFSEFKPDLILHVVGSEQIGYFEVVFQALSEINPKTKGKEVHVVYGWVRLKDEKMASREGKVVLGNWLIDEAKKRIVATYKTEDKVAEQIALGAVKYSFLKPSLTQEIAYDFNESISLEGNSGPYLQYTFARTQSVLRKAKSSGAKSDRNSSGSYRLLRSLQDKLNKEEMRVLRSLPKFPEVVAQAAKNYSPNLLCNYLFDLAQKYNNFYNQHRILESNVKGQMSNVARFRLALTAATGQVLKNGLYLLGIEAPERM